MKNDRIQELLEEIDSARASGDHDAEDDLLLRLDQAVRQARSGRLSDSEKDAIMQMLEDAGEEFSVQILVMYKILTLYEDRFESRSKLLKIHNYIDGWLSSLIHDAVELAGPDLINEYCERLNAIMTEEEV
jgi:hypothetical protein